jgi:hypothetical protein
MILWGLVVLGVVIWNADDIATIGAWLWLVVRRLTKQ